MDIFKQKLDILNEEAEKLPLVRNVAEKANVPPAYVLIGLIVGTVFFVVFGLGSAFIVNLACFAYPAYKSYKALESKGQDDDKQWLTYWTVYALFVLIDEYSEIILSFIPYYYLLKLCFLVWLFMPTTNGAIVIYENGIGPLFRKYGSQIEKGFTKVKGAMKDVSSELGKTENLVAAASFAQKYAPAPAETAEKPKAE